MGLKAQRRKNTVGNANFILSVKLLSNDLEALGVLAEVEDTTLGEQVHTALRRYIATRAKEKKFRKAEMITGKGPYLAARIAPPLGDQAKKFSVLCIIDGSTLGDEIRTAVHQYVASRAKENAFKKELRATRRRNKNLLKLLTKKPGD